MKVFSPDAAEAAIACENMRSRFSMQTASALRRKKINK